MSVTIFPSKEFVEGMISGVIASITSGLNALNTVVNDPDFKSVDGKLTECRALKGLLAVCLVECAKIEHCLKPFHEAALRPKHRDTRTITTHFIKHTLEHDNAKAIAVWEDDHPANLDNVAIWFLHRVLDFISTLHKVMHEDTERADRINEVNRFVGMAN